MARAPPDSKVSYAGSPFTVATIQSIRSRCRAVICR